VAIQLPLKTSISTPSTIFVLPMRTAMAANRECPPGRPRRESSQREMRLTRTVCNPAAGGTTCPASSEMIASKRGVTGGGAPQQHAPPPGLVRCGPGGAAPAKPMLVLALDRVEAGRRRRIRQRRPCGRPDQQPIVVKLGDPFPKTDDPPIGP
jgi:hypothetical protein